MTAVQFKYCKQQALILSAFLLRAADHHPTFSAFHPLELPPSGVKTSLIILTHVCGKIKVSPNFEVPQFFQTVHQSKEKRKKTAYVWEESFKRLVNRQHQKTSLI